MDVLLVISVFFALAQLALNAMKTVWRHLSEFSKQIVLNTFEHEFHIMA